MFHRSGPCIMIAAMFSCASPAASRARTAVPVERFLASIGVNTSFPDRGQSLEKTIDMLKFGGFRWVRAGIEGLSDDGPSTIRTMLKIHRATGVTFSWGLLSGGTDIAKLVATGRVLAQSSALLAFEGNNEPNNWPVTVDGVPGGGRGLSWQPVARLQQRLYAAVKADPQLARYPVWSISEAGAETDDVGLQFLTIPPRAGSALPAGTRFADAATLHNYPRRTSQSPLPDNLAWNAADPSVASQTDGLYGNYGSTWRNHFRGYSQADLDRLPRVTTETGITLSGIVNEETQGAVLLDIYLAQFARGFSNTSVYILRDRTDESGNQTFGFFRPDYTPRKAAVYLHNFTSILNRPGPGRRHAALDYEITAQPDTVHDLALTGRGGRSLLIVWDERGHGEDHPVIDLKGKHAIAVYDPTVGARAILRMADCSHLQLSLTDHPVIIELN